MTATYKPRGLIAAIVILIILGVASVGGAIVTAQATLTAKRDASIANNTLLRQVREQNYDLCQRAERIAAQAGLVDEPCVKPPPAEDLNQGDQP